MLNVHENKNHIYEHYLIRCHSLDIHLLAPDTFLWKLYICQFQARKWKLQHTQLWWRHATIYPHLVHQSGSCKLYATARSSNSVFLVVFYMLGSCYVRWLALLGPRKLWRYCPRLQPIVLTLGDLKMLRRNQLILN